MGEKKLKAYAISISYRTERGQAACKAETLARALPLTGAPKYILPLKFNITYKKQSVHRKQKMCKPALKP